MNNASSTCECDIIIFDKRPLIEFSVCEEEHVKTDKSDYIMIPGIEVKKLLTLDCLYQVALRTSTSEFSSVETCSMYSQSTIENQTLFKSQICLSRSRAGHRQNVISLLG